MMKLGYYLATFTLKGGGKGNKGTYPFFTCNMNTFGDGLQELYNQNKLNPKELSCFSKWFSPLI